MTLLPHPSRLAVSCAMALLGALPGMAHACGYTAFLGEVCPVARPYCTAVYDYSGAKPTLVVQYLEADGSLLNITAYQGLFSIIGTTYGGDGKTTFALPDLRGRAPVGAGTVKDLPAVALGQAIGQPQTTLVDAQIPTPAHTHAASFTPTIGEVDATVQASDGAPDASASATLMAGTSPTNGKSTPPAGTVYLSALSARAGTAKTQIDGPYVAGTPAASNQATLTADVSLEGYPASKATTATVAMIDDGKIVVSPSAGSAAPAAPARAPVPTQSPALGITYCIAAIGQVPVQN